MSSSEDTTIWAKLQSFKCPVKDCPSSDAFKWVCKVDGGDMFINMRGVMKCRSGEHIGNVNQWGWNCGNEYHKGEFHKADVEGFVFALSQALQLTGEMGAVWVSVLVIELGQQYERPSPIGKMLALHTE